MRSPISTILKTSKTTCIRAGLAAALIATAGTAIGGPLNAGHVRPNRAQRQTYVSQSDPAAVSLITMMLRAESTMNIVGTQVTQVNRNGNLVQSIQYVTRAGDHALRMDYLQPRNLNGERIVDDGTYRWRYIPKRNTLQVGPSTISKLDGRIRQLMNHLNRQTFTMRVVGSDNIAGHDCQIVEVDSLTVPPVVMRQFWIDPTNGAQLRINQYDNTGTLTSASYYMTITYNAAINPSQFAQPQTPQGVNVVPRPAANPLSNVEQAEVSAGFSALQPTYLPQGFKFQSASVMSFKGYKIIGLRYVNGVNDVLSLFETPEKNRPLSTIVHPRTGVAQATISGFRVIIVGSAADSDLDQMINSLH